MKRTIATRVALAALTLGMNAAAQTVTVDHWTQSQLIEKAQQLEQKAADGGSASAKLTEYPNHFTMIALRKKSGSAEIHEKYADFLFVLKGKATLVTGGTVIDPQASGPGESGGTSLSGGTRTLLAEGDVAHIPANVPHQLLLPKHSEFIYFVIKVQEK